MARNRHPTPDLARAIRRLADAVGRLAAPPGDGPPAGLTPVMRWAGGRLVAVTTPPPLALGMFRGVGPQIAALERNLGALAAGRPAHDMLLWGARGMGKSALVRSVAHRLALPLVEAAAPELESVGDLLDRLAPLVRPVLVFIDDLALDPEADGGRELRRLRSLLDGGVRARPPLVRLAVTSNHRHLLARPPHDGSPHARDHAEDRLALVDRFGLVLGFHLPDQATYLEMCRTYLEAEGLRFDEADALAFALARGSRSGRTAWHYRVECLVRAAGSAPLASENEPQ